MWERLFAIMTAWSSAFLFPLRASNHLYRSQYTDRINNKTICIYNMISGSTLLKKIKVGLLVHWSPGPFPALLASWSIGQKARDFAKLINFSEFGVNSAKHRAHFSCYYGRGCRALPLVDDDLFSGAFGVWWLLTPGRAAAPSTSTALQRHEICTTFDNALSLPQEHSF